MFKPKYDLPGVSKDDSKEEDDAEEATESADDESKEDPEKEKSDLGMTLGKAIKAGDGAAIYEAACAIYRHEGAE